MTTSISSRKRPSISAIGLLSVAVVALAPARSETASPASRPADALTAVPSAVIDPGFGWFTDRSPESLAAEIVAKGYRSVRYIVTRRAALKPELVRAFHAAGLPVVLTTFGNGVYSTDDLPDGWERWRMKRLSEQTAPGFTYLCLNRPEFVRWQQDQIVDLVKSGGFDAVEVSEAFWPAHGGPESQGYGCLCDVCLAKFREETGEEAPNFDDSDSSRFWKKQPEVYRKWVDARTQWATSFVDTLFNGSDGLRKRVPGTSLIAWGIASTSASTATMREWEGIDGEAIAREAKPDAYVIQTDWPDWLRPDLKPGYVRNYRPYIEAVRRGNEDLPILIQTDSGSNREMRRSAKWLCDCLEEAKKAGTAGVFPYMFSLEMDVYTEPIRLLGVQDRGNEVRLVLSKWPDKQVEDLSMWSVKGARLTSIVRDGCSVVVRLADRSDGQTVDLEWPRVNDDPSRRLFKEYPPCKWDGPSSCRLPLADRSTSRSK